MTAAQAALAERLVARSGRAVTFRRSIVTPDPARPWTAAGSTHQQVSARAVFVPPGSSGLGLRVTRPPLVGVINQIAITSLGASATARLTDFTDLVDTDGSIWQIVSVDELRPASISILYYVAVKK